MLKTRAVILREYNKPLFADVITIAMPNPDVFIVELYSSGICGSQLIDSDNSNRPQSVLLGYEVPAKLWRPVKI